MVYFQLMIDRKLEPLVKRLMMKYLGDMEEEDLVMFVLEHLKDHKGPHKLVEGLELVRIVMTVFEQVICANSVIGTGRGGSRTGHQCLETSYL